MTHQFYCLYIIYSGSLTGKPPIPFFRKKEPQGTPVQCTTDYIELDGKQSSRSRS